MRGKAKQTGNFQPRADIPQRLLTVEQLATYLNIKARSIYNRIGPKAKRPFPIKPKRVGRSVRFDREDVDRYIDSL